MRESVQTDTYYGRKRKVLIVEDNDMNREILSTILEDEFDILTAENGKIGYDILSEQYQEISLVLLDVYMPVMTGFEFLEKVKEDDILSFVPIIVTTGSENPEDEIKCLELGASDFVTKPYNPAVVIGRIHSIIKLKESVAALSIVEYDDLTGLYTLPAFYHHVGELLKANPDKSFDLSVANVKDFKFVNTYFGIQKGDELLKYIADKYKHQLPFSILARQGDKFYSVYETDRRFSPEVGAQYYADLIQNAPVSSVSIKYGIYASFDKSLSVSILCDRATMAAESIKNDFSKSIAFYDEKVESRHLENKKLEQDFEPAIQNKEFHAFYQPKVDTNSGRIVAAEALVRWIPDGIKMISPGAFIPLFEKDGLIAQLDEYIFRSVCEYQKKRITEGKRVVPISINLSRNSIYSKDVGEKYLKIVKDLNLSMELVPLEITESAAMQSDDVKKLAEHLVSLGFSLHMDDFGTGYSSLSSLSEMPFSVLKLDKSLVDQIGKIKGNILIKNMIVLAQEIGMKVVAEGVEEKSQLEYLKNVGCDMIQGYYFSAPKSETVFSEMLDQDHPENINIPQEYHDIHFTSQPEFEMDDQSLQMMTQMADEMLEGFLIYKAEPEEPILYANTALIKMFQCDSMEEFRDFTSNSFKGIVDSSDYEEVERSIFQQVSDNKNNSDAVKYHIVRRDGSKVFVNDRGHCVLSQRYGKIFYVYIKEN